MRTNLGRLAAVLGLVVGSAGMARAELVTYAFTAADATGREASGLFTYNTRARPYLVIDPPGPEGTGEFPGQPAFVRVEVAGEVAFPVTPDFPRSGGPLEIYLTNRIPGLTPGGDSFDVSLFGSLPTDPDRDFSFGLILVDADATAFTTHLALPAVLNLDDFETRTVRFSVFPGPSPSFSGQITSLARTAAVVPEPSTLALCAPVALAGAVLGWRRRRRKAT